MRYFDKIESGLNIISIVISLQDIYNVLSVILLCLSIASILYRLGYNIYRHFKDKEYDKINDDLDKATKDLDSINRKEDK